MPKPRRTDRPVEKTVNLDQSLVAQVDLLLFSDVEQKVPHGAWSRYLKGLIELDLFKRAQFAREQAGYVKALHDQTTRNG